MSFPPRNTIWSVYLSAPITSIVESETDILPSTSWSVYSSTIQRSSFIGGAGKNPHTNSGADYTLVTAPTDEVPSLFYLTSPNVAWISPIHLAMVNVKLELSAFVTMDLPLVTCSYADLLLGRSCKRSTKLRHSSMRCVN